MRRKWIGPALIGAMFVFSVVAYPFLPERIPTHWNIRWEVDGWSAKFPGAFITPCIALGLWLLMQVLPKMDPKRENYERFQETYWLMIDAIIGFAALIHVFTLGSALGWPLAPRMIMIAVGFLFIALGNYLPRFRPNWWMGIRTPWTLTNDKVWRDTHRLGGKLFVGAGLVTVMASLVGGEASIYVMIATLITVSVVSIVYSYVSWRREMRGPHEDDHAATS